MNSLFKSMKKREKKKRERNLDINNGEPNISGKRYGPEVKNIIRSIADLDESKNSTGLSCSSVTANMTPKRL